MPLLDHFHPPLNELRDWHSFHHAWATFLASELNRVLPQDYFAAPNVQYGIEIDVATFERTAERTQPRPASESAWSAPAPTATLPVVLLTDVVEVLVYETSAGRVLAAAIELVSPANKDRPAHRDAFVFKCASILQQGNGLVIVDIVTERQADLHSLLLDRICHVEDPSPPAPLYACSYRVVERDEQPTVDIWNQPLAVGGPLPTLPLWLRGGVSLPLDLESTYTRTRRDLRNPDPEP